MSGGKIKIELRFVDPVDECPEGRTENCNMPSYMGLVLISTAILYLFLERVYILPNSLCQMFKLKYQYILAY